MSRREIELKVEAIALDWKGSPIVILREKDGQRAVFIWVGLAEATAISMEMEKQQPPRPMTHDLIIAILDEMGVKVERVMITEVQDDTYYALLRLRDGEEMTEIDCRPSDAIAVALRAKAPIIIEDELLEELEQRRKEEGIQYSADSTMVEPGEPIVH